MARLEVVRLGGQARLDDVLRVVAVVDADSEILRGGRGGGGGGGGGGEGEEEGEGWELHL